MPADTASAPIIGMSVAAVAVLLVSSVRNTTIVTKIKIMKMRSSAPIEAISVPIHIASPEELTAAAKLNPPPNKVKHPKEVFLPISNQAMLWIFCHLNLMEPQTLELLPQQQLAYR